MTDLRLSYYEEIVAEAGVFAKEHGFEFVSTGIRICNDGMAAIEFSFDGKTADGKVVAGERIDFVGRTESRIWVKSVAGGELVRVFAWRGDSQV